MKAVLTRVSHARVSVAEPVDVQPHADPHTHERVLGEITAEDTCGILALVGIGRGDTEDDVAVMADKISSLRILPGEKSASDLHAPVLVVSQFTLQGKTAKGRRPSWVNAAPATLAKPIYRLLITELREKGLHVEEGEFGAMMRVTNTNEGPFTVLVDTTEKTGN